MSTRSLLPTDATLALEVTDFTFTLNKGINILSTKFVEAALYL